MKNTFNYRLRYVILTLFAGFVCLFIFRLIYGYGIKVNEYASQVSFFDQADNLRRNYASKVYKVGGNSPQQTVMQVDQKYEKIAEINTQSSQFETEEDRLRSQIDQHHALIQFEQKSGNRGNQRLNLLIGVPPEHFDTLYDQLVQIGQVQAKQITKKDKTNEYKELMAKQVSLEKIRNSLLDLKSKGGKIAEYIELENRILDIEQQLQGIGVNLGNFDDENEFCTIRFSLVEGKEVKISFTHRVKVALEWTVSIYMKIMICLFFLSLFAYVSLRVWDNLRGKMGRME